MAPLNRKLLDRFWLVVKYALVAVVLVFIIRGFILIPVPVDGNSMEDTLKQGDMILMEKFTDIQRFDVVVFQLPDGNIYIKRIIGLPGEKVDYIDDQLYIDDEPMDEPFLTANRKHDDESAPFTTDFKLEELIGQNHLPASSYFVLGDNRRMSKDSRSFGVVDSQYILGKAQFVYYPITHIKYIPR
ncbi:signal peptidase I [Enterococcus canis]|uniref:Signal peptidase I n=1 Tax=Enterococcus canis TaxID=214095 RepID=A0A1L8RHJ4_9ENTE|nr:signal peptidase I [Enterococcus canis]